MTGIYVDSSVINMGFLTMNDFYSSLGWDV